MSRILNMLAKALPRRISDSGKRQTMQVEVTKGELIDDVERMQQYGLSSNPPLAGTDCLVAFLGGNREQGVIIVAENRQFRLAGLESGEVALFDDLGNVVKLGRNRVEVQAVSELFASAPQVNITAGASSISISAAGVAITGPSLTHNGKEIGSTHFHVGSPSTAVPV